MNEKDVLQREIDQIKQRNKRVELDKAWETSWTRKITIIILTYSVISLIFTIIEVDRLFINAIVPALGYFLSTVSVGIIKKWWIENQ